MSNEFLKKYFFFNKGNLCELENKEASSVELQVSPVVVADDGGQSADVELGVNGVFGRLCFLEALDLVTLPHHAHQ